MNTRKILISDADAHELRHLLRSPGTDRLDQSHLDELRAELDRAIVLTSLELPATVVGLDAIVRVQDLQSGHRQVLQLVVPSEAELSVGRISVLAPLGTALLGYGVGDTVEIEVPSGVRRLRIEEVRQQARQMSWTRPVAQQASVS
ncbi:MAG: GreA/GreB family elongation factor [Steroidobacteraceae bacterium]